MILRAKHKFKRYTKILKGVTTGAGLKGFADYKPLLTNQHGQVNKSGWRPTNKVSAWFLLPKKVCEYYRNIKNCRYLTGEENSFLLHSQTNEAVF